MMKEPARTWRTAIIDVLSSAGEPLHYEEIAARIVRSGFTTAGKTPARTVSRELTTHPQLFEKTADGTYTLVGWHAERTVDTDDEWRSIASQGYQPNAEIRRTIELHAMQQASVYFHQHRWVVEDVSSKKPYDLDCSRPDGAQLCVEVKGTATDGKRVILTRNEVEFARAGAHVSVPSSV